MNADYTADRKNSTSKLVNYCKIMLKILGGGIVFIILFLEIYCILDYFLRTKMERQVTFDKNLVQIKYMVVWSFAYHSSRRGNWEEYARDRERFKRRIHFAQNALNVIFDQKHREKIFLQRFQINSVSPI